MMQFTEEQKVALIEHCKANIIQAKGVLPRLEEIDANSEPVQRLRKELQLQEIALAALTAEPVAVRYRWSPPHMKMPDGSQFYGDWKLVADAETANPGVDYERVNLYEAPPASAPLSASLSALRLLIESEIADYCAGLCSPGEPETPEQMQAELMGRIAVVFSDPLPAELAAYSATASAEGR